MNESPATLTAINHLLRTSESQQRNADKLANITGEAFNVFHILHVGHLEVTTHSPILASLLDSTGPHGQGTAFLLLFLQHFGITDFDAHSATTTMERYIGRLSDNSGGRIDIFIQDKRGNQILIENKIFARDQANQTRRYRKSFPNAHLFYLTPDGREPEDPDPTLNVRCISYAADILAWLKKCRKEAACVPTVRETITQYIHLLQDLTHQNTNALMDQELTRAVLADRDTYKAYLALYKAYRSIDTAIFLKLKSVLTTASGALDLQLAFSSDDLRKQYAALQFFNDDMRRHAVRIGFGFNQSERRGCVFGFCRTAENAYCPIEEHLFEAFKSRFPTAGRSPAWWVALTSWEQHSDWDDDTLLEIHFGSFHNEIMEKVKVMLEVFQVAKTSAAS